MSAIATVMSVRQPPATVHDIGSKSHSTPGMRLTRSANENRTLLRYPDRENSSNMTAPDTMVGTPSGTSTTVRTTPRSRKRA